MIGVLIRGVVRLVTKPQADKLISKGVAQKIPTRGQAAAQDAGKKVTTKEFNKLAKIKPKVVKSKPKTPEYTTSKLPVVSRGRAVSKTGGRAVSKTGKPLPLSLKGKPKGKLRRLASKEAIVPIIATGFGLSTLREGSNQTAQATTNGKKPKPNGKKPKPNGKKPPKPDYAGAGFTDTEESTIGENIVSKPKPKTLEQRLKAKFIKSHGGIDSFKPTTKVGKAVKGDISAKRSADSSWESELFKMREGSEGGRTYTDQQNYEKIMEERKGTTKKKHGGVIKRNKGGPIRGVGKALRGYGRATYSNKMY